MAMTARLLAIAQMVPACGTFFDIGADHGRLSAFLLREGRCRRAVATDISRKSLNKAEALFARLHLSERAEFHCVDGLAGLTIGERDCVAICGMGAKKILSILREDIPCPVVLSTHVDVEALRECLPDRGYRIERERLVREDRRFYSVMRILAGEAEPCRGADAYIGRDLRDDPLLEDYIAWREAVARDAARGGDPLWQERLAWIREGRTWRKRS